MAQSDDIFCVRKLLENMKGRQMREDGVGGQGTRLHVVRLIGLLAADLLWSIDEHLQKLARQGLGRC